MATPKTFSVIPPAGSSANSTSIYYTSANNSPLLKVGKNQLIRVAVSPAASGTTITMYLGNSSLTVSPTTAWTPGVWTPDGILLNSGGGEPEVFDTGENDTLYLSFQGGGGFVVITPISRS